MNNLSGLARNIQIGDLAAASFIGLTNLKRVGNGLFRDTTDKGYRKDNFVSNYKYTPSYHYIKGAMKPTGSKRFFFGRVVDAPNIDGIDIGWSYVTDINDYNLDNGFVSSADFEVFQKQLRTNLFFDVPDEDFYEIRFDDENSAKFAVNKGKEKVSRGDLYNTPETRVWYNPQHVDSLKNSDETWKNREAQINSTSLGGYKLNDGRYYNYYGITTDNDGYSFGDFYTPKSPTKRTYKNIFEERAQIKNGDKKVNILNWYYNQFRYSKYDSNKNNYRIATIANQYSTSNRSTPQTTFLGSNYSIPENTIIKERFFNIKENKPKSVKSDLNNDIINFFNTISLSPDSVGEHINSLKLISKEYEVPEIIPNRRKSEELEGRGDNKEIGLFVYSNQDRSRILDIINQFGRYSIKTPYLIGNKDEFDYYKVDGTYQSTKYNDIELDSINAHVHDDSTTFTYFNEQLSSKEKLENLSSESAIHIQRDNSFKSRLLNKTNQLFKENTIKTLVNRFESEFMPYNDFVNSTNSGTVSRGRNLRSRKRIWTAIHQYAKISDCIRPLEGISDKIKESGLQPGRARLDSNSTLQGNGFVKITPTLTQQGSKESDIKNCMFSIENLAWTDNSSILSKEQRGPRGGRIMWFPPYNLKFSENVSVNWNANNFIGRGEQIYTYTNTERSGTLDFTILIDHPSIMNKWRGNSVIDGDEKCMAQEELLEFFAGVKVLGDDLSGSSKKIDKSKSEEESRDVKLENKQPTKAIVYVLQFGENFDYNIDPKTVSLSGLKNISTFDNNIYTTLLKGFTEDFDNKYATDLVDVKNYIYSKTGSGTCIVNSVKVLGVGADSEDAGLRYKRANFAKKLLNHYYMTSNNIETSTNSINVSDTELSSARLAFIIFDIVWKNDLTPTIGVTNTTSNTSVNNSSNNIASSTRVEDDVDEYTYDNEYLYFSNIETTNYNVYKNIIDKIRYFDPAYHSITPEGFNARLTFLQQCTRQGPTTAVNSGKVSGSKKDENGNIIDKGSNDYLKFAGNLAFGRAPFCILRIGDFFNTKICIDSLSIQYDNGGGVQWDINPEGIGVQPMMAHITMNFKFLGGQDIGGPIEQLQNAVSSNYYANASIYDKQAKKGEIKKEIN